MEQDKTAVSLLFCTGLKRGLYSKLKTVTVRFKLPDSWLQYFVHSSVSMNPSQGIYGGIAAAVVDRS
jgi:hypothetical protein